MADAVTSQTLIDNTKDLVMRFTNHSDGTGESAVLKVDVSTLAANNGNTCTGVTIERIVYSNFGMIVKILWDATTDVTAAILGQDSGDIDLKCCGGISNNAGTGKTGDILFTTVGHTANDSYDITLFMKKNY